MHHQQPITLPGLNGSAAAAIVSPKRVSGLAKGGVSPVHRRGNGSVGARLTNQKNLSATMTKPIDTIMSQPASEGPQLSTSVSSPSP